MKRGEIQILIFLASISVPWFAMSANAATIIVPDSCAAVQAAVDATNNGDTVFVRAGVYSECIHVSGKNLVLLSESGIEQTILEDIDDEQSPILEVNNCDSIIVRGFSFLQQGRCIAGIAVDGVKAVILENRFDARQLPSGGQLHLRLAHESQIVNNEILAGGVALTLLGSYNVVIQQNRFIAGVPPSDIDLRLSTSRVGIFLHQSDCMILNNVISGYAVGVIQEMPERTSRIVNNVIMNCRLVSLLSEDMNFLVIRYNDFYNNRFNVNLKHEPDPIGVNGNTDVNPLFARSSQMQILAPDRFDVDARNCRIYEGFIGDTVWAEIEENAYDSIAHTVHLYDFQDRFQWYYEPGSRYGVETGMSAFIWHKTGDTIIPAHLFEFRPFHQLSDNARLEFLWAGSGGVIFGHGGTDPFNGVLLHTSEGDTLCGAENPDPEGYRPYYIHQRFERSPASLVSRDGSIRLIIASWYPGGENPWSPPDTIAHIMTRDVCLYCWDDEPDPDFHFGLDSPLIDAGDPDILDPDGSRSDIGSYPGGPYLGIRSDTPSLPLCTDFVTLAPNPFNDQFAAVIYLQTPGITEIELYTSTGETLTRHLPISLDSGSHQIVFSNLKYSPSGIYFLQVKKNGVQIANLQAVHLR